MLNLKIDDNLKQMGIAREIVNKIQKLRKQVGLNIDDQVEIFYEIPQSAETVFDKVLSQNLKAIKQSVKVPFLDAKQKQRHFVKIADTEYVNPENEKDVIKLHICVPNVSFDESKLEAKYGSLNKDKVNFVNDIKSFVSSHSVDALKKKIEENKGTLRFRLNEQAIELNYKEDFFLTAYEHSQKQEQKWF